MPKPEIVIILTEEESGAPAKPDQPVERTPPVRPEAFNPVLFDAHFTANPPTSPSPPALEVEAKTDRRPTPVQRAEVTPPAPPLQVHKPTPPPTSTAAMSFNAASQAAPWQTAPPVAMPAPVAPVPPPPVVVPAPVVQPQIVVVNQASKAAPPPPPPSMVPPTPTMNAPLPNAPSSWNIPKPPAPAPEPEPVFDPMQEARKQLEEERERRRRQREIDEAKAELVTPGGAKYREAARSYRDISEMHAATGKHDAAREATTKANYYEALGNAGAEGGAAKVAGARTAAADEAAKKYAAEFDKVSAATRAVADSMNALARNDNLEAVAGAADRTAEALGKIPVVGQVLESGIKMVTGAFRAARDVVESFVERGRQLSQYSAKLSMADAMSDIREMMSDIREAREVESGTAQLTDSWGELKSMLREILLPMKRFLVEFLAALVTDIAQGIKAMLPVLKAIVEAVVTAGELTLDAVAFQWGKMADTFERGTKRVIDALTKTEKDIHDPNWKADIDAVIAGAPIPMPGNDPVMGGAAARAPAIPLVI